MRVHADQGSAGAADNLGAVAYTTGSDIVFSAGSYQPDTTSGRWLVAHELAHVVQQAGAPPPMQSKAAIPPITAPHDPSEGAADAAAEAVLSGRSPATPFPVPAGTIQRSPGDVDGAVEPAAGMASRVVDGYNYRYEQFANGDIVVVEGPARVGKRYPKGDPVNKVITEQIELLHGPFPDAPADGGGGLLPSLDTILTTVRDSFGGLVDTGVASAPPRVPDVVSAPSKAPGLVEGAELLWDRLSAALFGGGQQGKRRQRGSARDEGPVPGLVRRQGVRDRRHRRPGAQRRRHGAKVGGRATPFPAGKKAGDPVVIPNGTKVKVSGTKGGG